jgi:FKBP-type peptidyl-prolyl cis-trans isomerase FkpA
MFGFFRKKRKAIPPQPSPPWVKWALIGFVALALIGNLRKGTPDAPNKVHEAFHQAAENLNPKKFFNLAEYKSVLFPGGELRIRDIKEGKGPSAICGQEVKIAYEAFIDKDKKIDDAATKEKPLAFRIGDGKAMPAFEQGVTGMKTGGTRSIFSPAGMAYGAKDFARKDVPSPAAVRFEVELLEATPALPDLATAPYRIATVTPGSGAPAMCGEVAHVRVLMWSVEGKKPRFFWGLSRAS